MEIWGKTKETASWLRKVIMRQSPSKEHKKAWEAFERDRMRVANVIAAITTISSFIITKSIKDGIDENDKFFQNNVNMEEFRRLEPWIWLMYFFA